MRFLVVLLLLSSACLAQSNRTVDKKFVVVSGAMFASAAFDYESTIRAIRCGGVENNPLFGRRPNRLRLYSEGFAIDTSTALVFSYYLKKRGSKVWWVPPSAVVVSHLFLGVRNLRRF